MRPSQFSQVSAMAKCSNYDHCILDTPDNHHLCRATPFTDEIEIYFSRLGTPYPQKKYVILCTHHSHPWLSCCKQISTRHQQACCDYSTICILCYTYIASEPIKIWWWVGHIFSHIYCINAFMVTQRSVANMPKFMKTNQFLTERYYIIYRMVSARNAYNSGALALTHQYSIIHIWMFVCKTMPYNTSRFMYGSEVVQWSFLSVMELLLISVSYLIYRIRYGWQWNFMYIFTLLSNITRSPARFAYPFTRHTLLSCVHMSLSFIRYLFHIYI